LSALLIAGFVGGALAAEPNGNASNGVDTDFFGLLRMRDLTPFGFRRLDMRPSHAVFAAPGSIDVEFDLGYQNTWTLSRNVDQYLRARTERGPLTEADVAAIRALPGEAYLVDLELGLIDAAINYKVDDRISLYAIVSAASADGGFLDGTIEAFHRSFGLGSAARPGLTRNQINVLYELKGVQVALLDQPSRGGLLDPVFGVRYSLARDRGFGNLVVEGAVKVPIEGERFLSTGNVDVGVQVTGQAFYRRSAWYAALSAVYFSGGNGLFDSPAMLVPTAIVGYEYRWSENYNLIAQAYASRSVFTSEQTTLGELRGNKFQFAFGVRRRTERGFWTLAITENARNFNNTPDVGFQLGFAFTVGPGA
jgi:hypothetical protein